jgi:hypothetical protein
MACHGFQPLSNAPEAHMRNIRIARPLYIPWLIGAVFLLGCWGGKTATVHGNVIFNNQPVTGGQITFYSADDATVNPAIGIINEDGTYSVDNVHVGKVTVTVDTRGLNPDGGGRKTPNRTTQRRPTAGMPEDVKKKIEEQDALVNAQRQKLSGKYVAIPDKFADSAKSSLSYDIRSGTKEITVELK